MRRSYRFTAAAAVCSLAATKLTAVCAFAPPSSASASFLSSKQSARQWLPTTAMTTTTGSKASSIHQLSMLPSSTLQLATEEPANSLIYTILHTPTLWSILAMTSIVALLVLWEETIHNIRSSTPKAIVPVIDSMLAEVGGLG